MTLTIQPISKSHDRKGFDCGVEPLNRFLRNTARQHQERSISRTFVLVEDGNPAMVLGFYTLTLCEVSAPDRSKLYENYPHRLPGLKLARLAVDKLCRGRNYGERLLISAIRKAVQISNTVGVIGLFVDAKDEHVSNFYQHYNFLPVSAESASLWLPIGTCKKLIGN